MTAKYKETILDPHRTHDVRCSRSAGSLPNTHEQVSPAGGDLFAFFASTLLLAFRLIHKPEQHHIFWGSALDEQLESIIDTFHHLGNQNVINRERIGVGYANRFIQAQSTFTEDGSKAPGQDLWNFFVTVSGTKRVTQAILADLAEAFHPFCLSHGSHCTDSDGDPYKELPSFLHPLVLPLSGRPDTKSIATIYDLTSTPKPENPWEMDVDKTTFGMKTYIPVIPPRGRYARQAAKIVSDVRDQFDLNIKLSFAGDGRALITIHFRTDEQGEVRRAEMAETALWHAMTGCGFLPYRTSIDRMQDLVGLRPDLFDTVGEIKKALDPNNIISPGRYCPAAPT